MYQLQNKSSTSNPLINANTHHFPSWECLIFLETFTPGPPGVETPFQFLITQYMLQWEVFSYENLQPSITHVTISDLLCKKTEVIFHMATTSQTTVLPQHCHQFAHLKGTRCQWLVFIKYLYELLPQLNLPTTRISSNGQPGRFNRFVQVTITCGQRKNIDDYHRRVHIPTNSVLFKIPRCSFG